MRKAEYVLRMVRVEYQSRVNGLEVLKGWNLIEMKTMWFSVLIGVGTGFIGRHKIILLFCGPYNSQLNPSIGFVCLVITSVVW